jgi:hypothetical protein
MVFSFLKQGSICTDDKTKIIFLKQNHERRYSEKSTIQGFSHNQRYREIAPLFSLMPKVAANSPIISYFDNFLRTFSAVCSLVTYREIVHGQLVTAISNIRTYAESTLLNPSMGYNAGSRRKTSITAF